MLYSLMVPSSQRVEDKIRRGLDFTYPLPAMDPSWGKVTITKLTRLMSVTGLTLYEKQAYGISLAKESYRKSSPEG